MSFIGGEYPILSPGVVEPNSGINLITDWINVGLNPIATVFSSGAPLSGSTPMGAVIINTCTVSFKGTFIKFDGGCRNVGSSATNITGIFATVAVFYEV